MPKARPFADLDDDLYRSVLERVRAHPLERRPADARVERMVRVVTRRLRSVTVLFDHVWNPHNRAAVLRTAEGLGVADVHVVADAEPDEPKRGITRGAEQWIEVHRHVTVADALTTLRADGFLVCAADVGEGCVPITALPGDRPIAIVLGNERDGLSEPARAAADVRFSIPMAGFTGSFNVSVSAAIGLWEVCTRRRAFLGRTGDLDAEDATQIAIDWMERWSGRDGATTPE